MTDSLIETLIVECDTMENWLDVVPPSNIDEECSNIDEEELQHDEDHYLQYSESGEDEIRAIDETRTTQ